MKVTRDDITILLQPEDKPKGKPSGGQSGPPEPEIDGQDEFEPVEGEDPDSDPNDDGDPEDGDQGDDDREVMDDIDQIMNDIDPGGKPLDEVLTPEEGEQIDPTKANGKLGPDGKPIDGFEGEGPQASERDWADAAKKAGSKMAGGGKGNMMLNAVYERIKPQQDWKKVLRDLIGKAANEWTLKFGNRRFISNGDYLYGIKQNMNALEDALVIVDVSGSVSDEALNLFMSEALHIAEAKKIKNVTVLFFDHGIQAVHPRVKAKDLLKVTTSARGGTAFLPVFEWVENNIRKMKFECILMFTDGCNGDGTIPSPRWATKFWWVIVDNPGYNHPWGRRVDISEKGITGK